MTGIWNGEPLGSTTNVSRVEDGVRGLALDSWLAEHLFGWRHVATHGYTIFAPPGWIAPDWDRYEYTDLPMLPAYSTTGDGMLLVLAALRERGWAFHSVVDRNGDGYVELTNWGLRGYATVAGGALPLAVALAARQALEAEEAARE